MKKEQDFSLALVESSDDAIIAKDLRGIVQSWNFGAELMYGYSGAEMVGKPISALIPADFAEQEAEIERAIQKGSRMRHFETVRVRKDGAPVAVSLTISPIQDETGRVIGASHVARDITERVELERAMAQLAAIVESSEDAIIGKTIEGVIQNWNSGAERLYGYTAEEAIGRSMVFLLPPDRAGDEEQMLSRIRLGEHVRHFETVRVKKNGQRVAVDLTLSPIRNHCGDITGVSHVARDVTSRLENEEAKARLAAIVESSEDAIIGKTLDGVILTWNRAAERIYGYTAEEARLRPMEFLIPVERLAEEAEILTRLRAGEQVEHIETERVRKDGKHITVSLTISPIRGKDGQIIGASHTARDISERKQFESELRQMQKLESLGVLAGGIAHDFNNLLTGILGQATVAIEMLSPSDPARERVVDVMRAAERAGSLTKQLLAYAGKGRVATGPVDLSGLVGEISQLVESSIGKKVQLRLQLDGNLPLIQADATQLQQVIMNLVINGAEAIGDKVGTVSVVTALVEIDEQYLRTAPGDELPAGKYVSLEVNDTGSGMDTETQTKIFDPFFTTKSEGRGLGLSAVVGIVRAHCGSLKVSSSPGLGTSFRILLPAPQSALAITSKVQSCGESLAGTGTVLVVDDEEVVRGFAKSALEHYGYQVRLAANGQAAVELFQKDAKNIDLVILDLTMPVMSGEEAFRKLRTIRPEVPMLLCSGFSEREAVRHFATEDTAGFIQKPFSLKQLAKRVKEAIQPAKKPDIT